MRVGGLEGRGVLMPWLLLLLLVVEAQ